MDLVIAARVSLVPSGLVQCTFERCQCICGGRILGCCARDIGRSWEFSLDGDQVGAGVTTMVWSNTIRQRSAYGSTRWSDRERCECTLLLCLCGWVIFFLLVLY